MGLVLEPVERPGPPPRVPGLLHEPAVAQGHVPVRDRDADLGREALVRVVVRGEPVAVLHRLPLAPRDPRALRVALVGPHEEEADPRFRLVPNPDLERLARLPRPRQTDGQGVPVGLPFEDLARVIRDPADRQVRGIEGDLPQAVVDRREPVDRGPGDRLRVVVHPDLESQVREAERLVTRRLLRGLGARERPIERAEHEAPAGIQQVAHRRSSISGGATKLRVLFRGSHGGRRDSRASLQNARRPSATRKPPKISGRKPRPSARSCSTRSPKTRRSATTRSAVPETTITSDRVLANGEGPSGC